MLEVGILCAKMLIEEILHEVEVYYLEENAVLSVRKLQ